MTSTTKYIGNSVSSQSADSTIYLPTRQTVLASALDSSGNPAFMAAGTGLRIALDASPTPMVLTFANGFGSYGAQDYVSRITSDASDMTGADLSASNTNFIFANYTSTTSVTWGNTLLPPQYGNTYDRGRNSLSHFEGADTSTTLIDDYGHTWSVAGNAQIDTAQFKFGASSLLLDGTGDYAETTGVTRLGTPHNDSWTVEGWFRFNALPTSTNRSTIFCGRTASDDASIIVYLFNNAGTTKTEVYLSSLGAGTYDIANGTVGTKTTWSTGTWYHWALTFDIVAGKYFLYIDGVSDISVTSSTRVSGFSNGFRIGRGVNSITTRDFNGWVDEVRISPCCRYPNGTTFTPSGSAFSVEGHWFSIQEMKMYEITSASASAGTNPGMTARNRVFVGEAVTGASSVSSVVNYALRGQAIVETAALALSTQYSIQHNLGIVPRAICGYFVSVLQDSSSVVGWSIGDETPFVANYSDGTSNRTYGWQFGQSNIGRFSTSAALPVLMSRTGTFAAIATYANWKARFYLDRGW